ncbi:hypothetical protein PACTADRAFT_50066 [Pachysolen tannophilus NRRL Y-2460]|uniref:Dol-P-Man:Man(5)GlcNAc(2)-PP-Dol alpha-1,3-mannosyltransferase n=1 Tax=Pachysolen tannophilus NRRL Y-2460 TaxID=669874 RepID=A0A1E4TUB0_PACTA|nr:hypothetical protein PACTADRAFT_50066 [Pachysolen tannophilus NRRL Y-2460]
MVKGKSPPALDGFPKNGSNGNVDVSGKELPELNLSNVLADVYDGIIALFVNPSVSFIAAMVVLLAESIILKVIISKVPYTEIDFTTYMQQVTKIENGELNYANIFGDTGDLVYPAGHVDIYTFLKWVSKNGTDLLIVQKIFSWVYLFTMLLTIGIYFSITNSNIKPWCIWLLFFSKRLHSIYVLRLFNDCFTTITCVGVILLLTQASYWKSTSQFVSYMLTIVAADLYSLAISIKMNALLYLPGFLLVVYLLCDENLIKMMVPIMVSVLIQILTSLKFLLPLDDSEEAKEIRKSYLAQAFNFKRKFLYKWTVNWKFLPEEFFLDANFHKILLILHVVTLAIFILTRWITPKTTGKSFTKFLADFFKFWKSTAYPTSIVSNHNKGPRFVFIIMSISNLIGVLYARSLHYQFLSWYFYSLPILLFFNNFNMFLNIAVFFLHEWCWNVYPSTPLSSGVLIACLAFVLVGIWWNDNLLEEKDDKKLEKKEK